MSKYANVRIGLLVTREDSKYSPFHYHMFHCRQREIPKDRKYCPLADWADEEVGLLSYRGFDRLFRKMKVGETRRYWVHLTLLSWKDYQGECDSDVELHSLKRAK